MPPFTFGRNLHERNDQTFEENSPAREHPILDEAARQINEYFRGERVSFDLRLEFHGTAFQNKVWRALQKIPYGSSTTYEKIAKSIGSEKAFRAVGSANGKNPLSIIIPCHRVKKKDGNHSGFAGGIENKEVLIALESKVKLANGPRRTK
jgi:methylated-DNA-[protein]-cysteine S-methyltransferase